MDGILESICQSPLWNPKAVYATNPDFTFCFEHTIFMWAPCLVLWIVSPLWVYMLTKPCPNKIKVSWILISKTVSIVVLISIELANILRDVLVGSFTFKTVNFVTSSILILTYLLAMLIIHFERVKGLKASTLILTFWTLLALTNMFTFRTNLLHLMQTQETHKDMTTIYLFFLFYAIVLFNIVISCFTEEYKDCGEKEIVFNVDDDFENKPKKLKVMPENHVSLLSKLSFWWINDLILTGYKRDLVRDDLWSIEESEGSESITKKLEIAWDASSSDYIKNMKSMSPEEEKSPKKKKKNDKNSYKTDANNKEEEIKLTEHVDVSFKGTSRKLKKPSLGICLCKVYAGKFLAGASIKLIQDLLLFASPILLDKLINFIKDRKQNIQVGLFYTFLLFVCSLVQSFALQHYFHRMFIVGARIRTSIMNIVYKKSLRLSTTARKQATVGEMTNLVSINAQTFAELTTYLNILWSAPLQITICIFMLWQYLGIACIIGVSLSFVLIPLNLVISKKIREEQMRKQKTQDSRIKMMNEILSGIKVLKFYGWELSFMSIINKIRKVELGQLRQQSLLSIVTMFLWGCSPLIITIVSFGTFILLNESDKFTVNVAFVSISLFNILRFPLSILPGIIAALINANVSLKRIETHLLREEINENDISYEDIPDVAIRASKANFGWDAQKQFLSELNFDIKKGKLVAIVGKVGSGKSTLLSAILGEMHKLNDGIINVNGSVAYVPQQAWIQNLTVKNNILFGNKYNEKFYEQVLDACCLKTDLQIMPAGDKTEIGEKGINLSGGQKQRISLARSVYTAANIYLLDDPLSAVDSHVGKSIFDKVIGPNGLLKDKTRLFVTNSLSFLPQCDEVYMLDNGQLVEIGTYEGLLSKGGEFSEFIKKYLSNEVNVEEEVENLVLNDSKIELVTENKTDGVNKLNSSIASLNKSSSHLKKNSSTNIHKEVDSEKKEGQAKGETIIQKEKIETGKVKFAVIKQYFMASNIFLVISFIFLFSIANLLNVGSNLWISYWTKNTNNQNDNEENSEILYDTLNSTVSNQTSQKFSNLFYFLIYAGIGLSQCIVALISDFMFLIVTLTASSTLHRNMLFSILRSPMEFFEKTPIGRIINRFSKDVEAVERSIPDSFKMLARCFFHVFFTIMVVIYSTPWFTVTLIPIIIIYVFVQRYFVSSMRQLRRLESASKSPIFSHFSESLNGSSTIRAYKVEKRFIKKFAHHVDENLLYYFPNNISNRWLALRLELIGNLITVFAALFAVLAKNHISPGLVGLSISYAMNVSQTLNWLVRMTADFESNIVSVERIKEYCEVPHEEEWSLAATKPKESWPDHGHLEFKNYSVKYRKDLDNVLNGINADIQPGEKIGIVGRTGAGKSSLALGLFRLLEYSEGTILIDGVDIKKIGLHDLRHKLTIIPQDPVLFSETLRVNLDPFSSYTEDQLWAALEAAHLKDFVMSTDKKLNFECSEGGENMSVGQRQLVCLCRALLRKTKILILDEATASIDHNTDDLIQKTIRTQFLDCTVLTIAHRLNTIMDSSRIMVLDKGRIIEFDTPENLLKNKSSCFYSMAKDAGLV